MKRALVKLLKWALLFDLLLLAAAQIAKLVIPQVGDEESDVFQVVTMTGGEKWASRAGALRSGTLITGMAGVEVDLSRATLDPAGAHLRLITVMGGVEMRVPPEWNVELEGMALMSGHINNARRDDADEETPRLTIEASSVMSGVIVTAAEETVPA